MALATSDITLPREVVTETINKVKGNSGFICSLQATTKRNTYAIAGGPMKALDLWGIS